MSTSSNKIIQKAELYKETLSNMRRGLHITNEDCPLNSPNLGVISENDHLTRRCLCPICICGKHICPSLPIPEPFPSSIFNSQYMSNFRSKSPDPALIPKNRGNFFPAVAFTFETTNEDYRPHRASSVNKCFKNVPGSPPKIEFNAKSNYCTSFVNWGTGINEIVKKKHEKHTMDELKLNTKSSYKESFCNLNQDFKVSRTETAGNKHKNHINTAARFIKETTNRREFVDYSKNYMKEKEYKQNHVIPKMKSYEKNYVTTHMKDFKTRVNEMDHSMMRKVIDKECLISN